VATTLQRSHDGLTYRRRPTRTVHVGDVAVGSDYPIRVQSMTTPATTDTAATVDQIERLVHAGCEIVRVTVPTSADADNLPAIRRELARRGLAVPLVADIHFTPAAAMRAIEHVEKIRINPGNYADKKKFQVREYTDEQYRLELERIERVFSPLVRRAQELGVAMRIGTNHGSLSDRIMNRYGDTPLGMVESALEFVRICEAHGYHDVILSMKASNPLVVLQAYRLLALRLAQAGMDYPFHLGVTEAGDGEDGRIKSAIGIGVLLEEGLGDTVRVSLTEDPVREIPVARALVQPYNERADRPEPDLQVVEPCEPTSYARRASHEVGVGPHRLGGASTVLVDVPLATGLADGAAVRRELDAQAGVRVPEETRAEIVTVALAAEQELTALVRLREAVELVAPKVALSALVDGRWLLEADEAWLAAAHRLHLRVGAPFCASGVVERLLAGARRAGRSILLELEAPDGDVAAVIEAAVRVAVQDQAETPRVLALALAPARGVSPLHATRLLAARLGSAGATSPIVALDDAVRRGEDPLLAPAAALGGLLCDGIGDAIQVAAPSATDSRRLAFNILQAARVRTTKTEFISCPSCGRTLFDLEETTARIKLRTAHLKGLKIAVMGCVVNGPGEMADADFGYVGWGENKIALFVGKELVAKDVPTAEADARLVELIKAHGRWVEPRVAVGEEAQ
jgi:(E)-4-hydroxy-3-methylbut-2-enyl-diphosphate synthase